MKGCRILNDDEIKVLMESMSTRDKALILTGLTFGTRISETLSLSFGDVSGEYLCLRSQKGSENQAFPIPESYRAVIHALKAAYEAKGRVITPTTPLFLSQKGINKPITRQQASQIIKKAAGQLGIDGKVNTHSLRKSFVSKIYDLTGFNIAETQTYSRHKNLSNLQYYLQTTQSTQLVKELKWT